MTLDPVMNVENLTKFRQDMMRDLRSELAHLKTCQNNSITFGIAGAGLMLGLIKSEVMKECIPFYFLLPLIILLPFWLIFFEKIRTISRITSFIRIQEKLCLACELKGTIGWESALQQYWLKKNIWDNNYHRKQIETINSSYGSSRSKYLRKSMYWFIVFLVFYSLSIACIILGFYADYTIIGQDYITYSLICLISLSIVVFHFLLNKIVDVKVNVKRKEGINLKEEKKYSSEKTVKNDFDYFIILCLVSCIILLIPLSKIPDFNDLNTILHCLIFEVCIVIFYMVSMMCFWFFQNIVKGRYTYDAFEYRWWFILDLDYDKYGPENRITLSTGNGAL